MDDKCNKQIKELEQQSVSLTSTAKEIYTNITAAKLAVNAQKLQGIVDSTNAIATATANGARVNAAPCSDNGIGLKITGAEGRGKGGGCVCVCVCVCV